MKKNITMNLFGTLYAIDDDAYQLLEHYLESMSNYFSKQDGGEEIADDIEHRVAELLWKQKEKGNEVVNIEMITDIIKIIGNPAEIDENPSENGVDENTEKTTEADTDELHKNKKESITTKILNHFKYRHLYRVTDDKLIGGVCSGFSKYFDFSDSTFWRILFVIIFILFVFIDSRFPTCFATIFVGAYIVLWIIVPRAKTTEDTLRMKGKEVNPNNLKEEIIMESKKKNKQYYTNNSRNKNGGGCLKGLLNLILGILLIPLFALLALIIFASIMSAPFIPDEITYGMRDLLFNSWNNDLVNCLVINNGSLITTLLICSFISVVIPIFLIIHKLRSKRKPLNIGIIITLVVTWILAIVITLIILIGNTSLNIKKINKIHQKQYEIECQNMLENELKNENKEEKFIDENEWFILTLDNCADNRCTYSGEYLDGNTETRYLDAYNRNAQMKYTASHIVKNVQPGLYRLCAHARAQDKGAFIYLTQGETINDSNRIFVEIPAYGDNGGELWHWAKGHISDEQAHIYGEINSKLRRDIMNANNGKGYGWSKVVIDSIKITKPTTIYYGVSTDDKFTGTKAQCQWFSVTDFSFEKIPNNTYKRKK